MAQRISRAKRRIKESGIPFAMPTQKDRSERLSAVLHVLYLIFNEGYASSFGPNFQRNDLASEAIRLARAVHRSLPDHAEAAGLLALMLLTHAQAKRPDRCRRNVDPSGETRPIAVGSTCDCGRDSVGHRSD